jgi:hypothetical protein
MLDLRSGEVVAIQIETSEAFFLYNLCADRTAHIKRQITMRNVKQWQIRFLYEYC